MDPQAQFTDLSQVLTQPQYGSASPNLTTPYNRSMRGIALQNALDSLKMGDINLQGQEEQAHHQHQMDMLKQQEPGVVDYLGLLPSLFGAGRSIKRKVEQDDSMGQQRNTGDSNSPYYQGGGE